MDKRKISLLQNITVARGASPNEEDIAKRKIAQYAERISRYQTAKPTKVHIYEDLPLEEHWFRMKWETLKRENRKKWKVE